MKSSNQTAILQAQAFASQLLPAFIGVGSFMLLVRHADQEVLGQFLMYMAAVTLFDMIKSGGLQSALVMRLSGTNNTEQVKIIGSAYWLGGLITGAISLVLFSLFLLNVFAAQPGIHVFCGWYALLGIITLPLHVAEASAVAKQDIRFLLWLRILQSINSLSIALYALFQESSLQQFATLNLVFNVLVLIIVLLAGKTNPLHITKKVMAEVKQLFHLIRFTLATLAATNVLKSADTFLLGSFLGPKAVAAYAVPLKLTELFEIPLRSLSTTAFPQLAAKNNAGDGQGFRTVFTQYLSWSYLLYVPALMGAFVLAPFVVTLLGGSEYAFTAPVFQVFVLYGLLLPADRLTGIGLDALQKPKWNLVKVLLMAAVNLTGDAVAIYFGGKLEWIAAASVLNAATGACFGLWMLKRSGVLSPARLLPEGYLLMKKVFVRQS